jgi:tRNA pseudouridine55 synthase
MFAQDLLDADKTYEATVQLGVTTTTGDTEGEVIDTKPVNVSPEQVEAVVASFRGAIRQVPPMYSALKREGKPLYEYAREGITLEREARNVIIHVLELLEFAPPYLKLRVTCSKGTYVRVLGEDIGAALGCGAHLAQLKRTQVAHLSLNEATSLSELEAIPMAGRFTVLSPVDSLASTLPPLCLPAELSRRFLHGQRLALGRELENQSLPAGRVRVLDFDGKFLGTAAVNSDKVLIPERVIAAALVASVTG